MGSIKAALLVISGLGIYLIFAMAICFALGVWLWPYTINSWLAYSGKDPCIEWWMGGLMGMIPGLGQASIPAAFATFILMLFLV